MRPTNSIKPTRQKQPVCILLGKPNGNTIQNTAQNGKGQDTAHNIPSHHSHNTHKAGNGRHTGQNRSSPTASAVKLAELVGWPVHIPPQLERILLTGASDKLNSKAKLHYIIDRLIESVSAEQKRAGSCVHCRAQKCLFNSLSNVELKRLWDRYRIDREYKKGAAIFYEGEKHDGLYFVDSGRVKLIKGDSRGANLTLGIAKPGWVFGYRAFVLDSTYWESAIALDPETRVSHIRGSYFDIICALEPSIHQRMAEIACKELGDIAKRIIAKISGNVKDMVVDTLKEYRDGNIVTLPRKEIADLAWTTIETCVRTLKILEDGGFIDRGKGNVNGANGGNENGSNAGKIVLLPKLYGKSTHRERLSSQYTPRINR